MKNDIICNIRKKNEKAISTDDLEIKKQLNNELECFILNSKNNNFIKELVLKNQNLNVLPKLYLLSENYISLNIELFRFLMHYTNFSSDDTVKLIPKFLYEEDKNINTYYIIEHLILYLKGDDIKYKIAHNIYCEYFPDINIYNSYYLINIFVALIKKTGKFLIDRLSENIEIILNIYAKNLPYFSDRFEKFEQFLILIVEKNKKNNLICIKNFALKMKYNKVLDIFNSK